MTAKSFAPIMGDSIGPEDIFEVTGTRLQLYVDGSETAELWLTFTPEGLKDLEMEEGDAIGCQGDGWTANEDGAIFSAELTPMQALGLARRLLEFADDVAAFEAGQ